VEVERVALRLGFVHIRAGKGSHRFYRHPDGRTLIIAFHGSRTVPPGTLRKIIADMGLTVEEFNGRV
jgi:predicted RNA binding protein YcfA (HicA-like mRNA interferase family)